MRWRAKHARCPYERLTLDSKLVAKWVFKDAILPEDNPKKEPQVTIQNEREKWHAEVFQLELNRRNSLRSQQIAAEQEWQRMENAKLLW